MVFNNVKGFDGPYEAPLKLPTRKVLKSWIDYNGHMNVAYYTMAIDNSIDYFLEEILGIGETHAKTNDQGPFVVQANFNYLNEMVHKQKFFVQCSLINFDTKKMHLFLELISSDNNQIMAYSEQLLLNVNLKKRKTENYSKWVVKRLKQLKNDHKNIQFPENIGLSIKIKNPIL